MNDEYCGENEIKQIRLKYAKCKNESCLSASSVTQQQLRDSRRPTKSHDFDSNLNVNYYLRKFSFDTHVKNTVFSRIEGVVQMEKL